MEMQSLFEALAKAKATRVVERHFVLYEITNPDEKIKLEKTFTRPDSQHPLILETDAGPYLYLFLRELGATSAWVHFVREDGMKLNAHGREAIKRCLDFVSDDQLKKDIQVLSAMAASSPNSKPTPSNSENNNMRNVTVEQISQLLSSVSVVPAKESAMGGETLISIIVPVNIAQTSEFIHVFGAGFTQGTLNLNVNELRQGLSAKQTPIFVPLAISAAHAARTGDNSYLQKFIDCLTTNQNIDLAPQTIEDVIGMALQIMERPTQRRVDASAMAYGQSQPQQMFGQANPMFGQVAPQMPAISIREEALKIARHVCGNIKHVSVGDQTRSMTCQVAIAIETTSKNFRVVSVPYYQLTVTFTDDKTEICLVFEGVPTSTAEQERQSLQAEIKKQTIQAAIGTVISFKRENSGRFTADEYRKLLQALSGTGVVFDTVDQAFARIHEPEVLDIIEVINNI